MGAATDIHPQAPPGFAFADPGLDRADHLREDPQALAALWRTARVLVIDGQGRTVVDGQGRLFPAEGEALGALGEDAVFLGLHQGRGWFAVPAETPAGPGAETPAAQAWLDLRSAAVSWPPLEASVFAQARAVQHWRSRHRHCGVCGGPLAFVRGGWLGRCGACGTEHYPRTDPAVIVAVSDGERLLLGRQAAWPPNRYSTLAGFVEPGETPEQTVAREVMEESGVRVRSSRYLAAQPWPFPGSLMLGFAARAEPDAPRASDELEDVRWFTRAEVGAALEPGTAGSSGLLLSPRISISRWLIERWYAGGADGG